jgi:hypothetical protein
MWTPNKFQSHNKNTSYSTDLLIRLSFYFVHGRTKEKKRDREKWKTKQKMPFEPTVDAMFVKRGAELPDLLQ